MRPIDAERLTKYLRNSARCYEADDPEVQAKRDGILLTLRTIRNRMPTISERELKDYLERKKEKND